MEKRLIDYLHYYIGQKVKWYEVDEDPRGVYIVLTAQLLTRHTDDPDQTYIELYLIPVGEISPKHVRALIDYTPNEFGDNTHWLIKRGYDVFGLIKAGLAKHKHTLYE